MSLNLDCFQVNFNSCPHPQKRKEKEKEKETKMNPAKRFT